MKLSFETPADFLFALRKKYKPAPTAKIPTTATATPTPAAAPLLRPALMPLLLVVEFDEPLLDAEDVAIGRVDDDDVTDTAVVAVELLVVRSDCWNRIATLYALMPPYPEKVLDDAYELVPSRTSMDVVNG